MDVSGTTRIVLLGKAGVGKSSLANTIFGEAVFQRNSLNGLKAHGTEVQTKSINGRSITLIDTPGFFDADRSEEEMKTEIFRLTTECAPGPHAFLIVLKVEKFTKHEQAVIAKIFNIFSEDALRHAIIVFTDGDQLPEGMEIKEFVDRSEDLSALVRRCGGRCSVVDNKYWKSVEDDDYRDNKLHVAEMLDSIEKLVKDNNGGYYTNEQLQKIEKEIQKEEEKIRKSGTSMSEEEVRKQAKNQVFLGAARGPSTPWLKGLVGLAGLAILVGIIAVVIKIKFGNVITEETIAPAVTEAVEEIADAVPQVSPSAPEIIERVKDIIKPELETPQECENILDKFDNLCKRTYNPWNNE